jgi:hypothetical protein
MEGLAAGVATTEGSELGTSPGTEPRVEGTSSGDARREYAITEMPDEDLTPPEEAAPPDAPGPPETPSRAEAGQSPRTEPISPPSGEGDIPPGGAGETTSPRPESNDEFPGTEPIEGEDPTARSGEVPPPPEEIPPERAGEIPMAEEVPAPRTEEVPSGNPSQPPPGDVQRDSTQGRSTEEVSEEEGAGPEERQDRGLVERLTDRARDAILGEEEQRGEGTGRPDRR